MSAHPEADRYPVQHNEARHRFEVTVEGQLCVADYRLASGAMQMTHTGVPVSLEGRGIAAALVKAAIAHARAHQLKINPLCSYVRVYMQRHPETLDLLA